MRCHIAFVALLTLGAACADSTPSAPARSTLVPTPRPTTLTGTIVVNDGGAGDLIQLATDAADTVTLLGPMASAAARDAGTSRVAVTGELDDSGGMLVEAYTVLASDCPIVVGLRVSVLPACNAVGANRRR